MKTTPASFNVSRTESKIIGRIADRAIKMKLNNDAKISIEMDVTACHASGCPLDLLRLLEASDADFGHDVTGIRKFIDRSTGELTGIFHPRCAQ